MPDVPYPGRVRAAAVQLRATADRNANLDHAAELVGAAAADGADLVVLPEHVAVAGGPEVLAAAAEPLEGTFATWASGLARSHGIWLVAGTFPERIPGRARPANTCVVASPDGRLAAAYRKVHLFDAPVAGVRESDATEPGEEVTTVALGTVGGAQWHLGLAICFDLRFPELFLALALRGAGVVAVPSAFTAVTGPAHWETLVRARAIDAQCFVVAADQEGRLPPGMPACHGHSMIVDPWGRVLAEAGPGAGFIAADLDASVPAEARTSLPVLTARRPAVYRRSDE